ncbi:MAG: hypothetical protein JO141_07000 [Bradyrhizobium sp.]|nr:hypothetical protein [Bradyrhizobium sp.]
MPLRPCLFLSSSRALAAVATLLLVDVGKAWSQAASPQPQVPTLGLQEQPPAAPPQAEPAAPESQPSQENPGLINELGKLIDRITPSKSTGETLDDFNARTKDAMKGAGDALSRLSKTGAMVSGRTACPAAADGTPDCKTAADQLCKGKGYGEGKSLNTDSAEKCSAKVLIPGRKRKPDDCHTDTYVTTALCQ